MASLIIIGPLLGALFAITYWGIAPLGMPLRERLKVSGVCALGGAVLGVLSCLT